MAGEGRLVQCKDINASLSLNNIALGIYNNDKYIKKNLKPQITKAHENCSWQKNIQGTEKISANVIFYHMADGGFEYGIINSFSYAPENASFHF